LHGIANLVIAFALSGSIGEHMKTNTALVLIDVQCGLIEGFEDDWAGGT
jgi:hypothetical protein